MATLHSESSKELMRSSHDGRPLLFLIRGKGLRSRWQSRQSDCAERRRRSSEFKGALHSSQRGGPTRPLWSCAIEIPPGRTQTGEQMKQQSCVVKQAWFYAALIYGLFGRTLGTSSFCGGVKDHRVPALCTRWARIPAEAVNPATSRMPRMRFPPQTPTVRRPWEGCRPLI